MRYHLVIQTSAAPIAVGPYEAEKLPTVGDELMETIEDNKLNLQVVGITHLPVIPGGTAVHDEIWVACRVLKFTAAAG
jgi:hypothetical protein